MSVERWRVISTIKHPVMAGREAEVRETLANPLQVRRSRTDPEVLLFYRSQGPRRWVYRGHQALGRVRVLDHGQLNFSAPTSEALRVEFEEIPA